jgi:hypothetical protein
VADAAAGDVVVPAADAAARVAVAAVRVVADVKVARVDAHGTAKADAKADVARIATKVEASSSRT